MTLSTNAQPRAAIYTRVSSDEQTKGHGLEYQLADCRRAIEERGHTLAEIYSDPGITGTIEDRPGLNRLREDARAGKFDILYFWKSDRLARDEIIQLSLYREFKQLGIETCSVSEPAMNELMRGIYAVFGAEDLRNIKAKMYSGRIQAMRVGKWIGTPPYGYRKNDAFRLVVHEPEAQYLKQIFTWFVEHRLSLQALVRRLHEHGVPTRWDVRGQAKPHNGKGFWSSGALGRLLKREYYSSGEVTRTIRPELALQGGASGKCPAEQVRIAVPPIVPLELFQHAQERLRHNHQYARRRAKRVYLFAKKLICGVCGLKLTGSCRPEREGLNYYRNDRLVRERRCQSCRYYSECSLDSAVWPRIVSLFRNPEVFIDKLEIYRRRGDGIESLLADQRRLIALEAKLVEQEKGLLRLELEKFYEKAVLEDKKRDLKAERAALAERRRALEGRIRAAQNRLSTISSAQRLYETLRASLENATHATKAQVYQLLIEKIVLNGDSAEVWVTVSDGVACGETVQSDEFVASLPATTENAAADTLRTTRSAMLQTAATVVCNPLHTRGGRQTAARGVCDVDNAWTASQSTRVAASGSMPAVIVFPIALSLKGAKKAA